MHISKTDGGTFVSVFESNQLLAYVRVDEHLALSLSIGSRGPHLMIENLDTGKKKATRLSWMESAKELQIKIAKGKTQTYPPDVLRGAVNALMEQVLEQGQIRSQLWKLFRFFSVLVHEPKNVMRESELRVLSEEKRRVLWLACFASGDTPGVLRPCFAQGESERAVLGRFFKDHGEPWGIGIPLEPGERGVVSLKKRGIAPTLMTVYGDRWYRPIMLASAGTLMGMSDWSGDDEGTLGYSIWRPLLADVAEDLADKKEEAAKGIVQRLRVFIKHFHRLPLLSESSVLDSHDALKAEGYGRRERFDENTGALGNVVFDVTRYVRDDGQGALTCRVKGPTFPPKEDLVLRFGPEVYEEALHEDACGSMEDSRFTMVNLIQAKQMQKWIGMAESLVGILTPPLEGGS
jgi:hypothetical protein